jgi:hypothetical protein
MYSPSKIMLRAGTAVMGFLIVRATLWLRAIMSFFAASKVHLRELENLLAVMSFKLIPNFIAQLCGRALCG